MTVAMMNLTNTFKPRDDTQKSFDMNSALNQLVYAKSNPHESMTRVQEYNHQLLL
jgi:hypothetical protein